MTADWLHRYNRQRPHESPGRIPSVEYRRKPFPKLDFRLDQENEEALAERRIFTKGREGEILQDTRILLASSAPVLRKARLFGLSWSPCVPHGVRADGWPGR